MGTSFSSSGDVSFCCFGQPSTASGKVLPLGEYSDYQQSNLSASQKKRKRVERRLGLYLASVASNSHGLPYTKRDLADFEGGKKTLSFGGGGAVGGSTTCGLSQQAFMTKVKAFFPSDSLILTYDGARSKGPAGQLTQSFLSEVFLNGNASDVKISLERLLQNMQQNSSSGESGPRIMSSRQLDLSQEKVQIGPMNANGKLRALLVSTSNDGATTTETSTAPTDTNGICKCCYHTLKVKEYIEKSTRKNRAKDIHVMTCCSNTRRKLSSNEADEKRLNGSTTSSGNGVTRQKILSCFEELVDDSKDGDSVFVYICGKPKESSDSELLIDVDFYNKLLGPMRENVAVFCLLDYKIDKQGGECLDLPLVAMPYVSSEDDRTSFFPSSSLTMIADERFSFLKMLEGLHELCKTNFEYKPSETAMATVLQSAKKNLDTKRLLFS